MKVKKSPFLYIFFSILLIGMAIIMSIVLHHSPFREDDKWILIFICLALIILSRVFKPDKDEQEGEK